MLEPKKIPVCPPAAGPMTYRDGLILLLLKHAMASLGGKIVPLVLTTSRGQLGSEPAKSSPMTTDPPAPFRDSLVLFPESNPWIPLIVNFRPTPSAVNTAMGSVTLPVPCTVRSAVGLAMLIPTLP